VQACWLPTKIMKDEQEIKNHIAGMLLQLVKEHKQHCEGAECNLSLFLIYERFYKPFVGEEEAKKNFFAFM
jgi:hypothetical protein